MRQYLYSRLAAAMLLAVLAVTAAHAADRRPNVVLIITDDQGYGDFGFHGNDNIKTPHLDAFARQSVVLKNFYVSPVCAPTRASLLTGRYNYRTGAIDTYRGRAMMHPDEITLAEILHGAGYRTGIFGKWHLGDNYPLRAQDQGFDEALTLWGGGLRQTADPPEAKGNRYLDPWLSHNGDERRFEGYCSDIYTDAAMSYISTHRDEPFFVYLAYNCPHTPLDVREQDYLPYQQMGLDDTTAKVYGMVTNIDDNVGRLLAHLGQLKLADNTIVIFMTDNGPQQPRYNGNWRGLKGSVYEGGIHVPCFVRWPRRLESARAVEQPAAHIDILPTLLAACGVQSPKDLKLDGRNLLPLLSGESAPWPERHLFFQWHRGDAPQLFRACAIRGPRYKLVQAAGAGEEPPRALKFELFDLLTDPGEKTDLARMHPDVVAQMKAQYETWFRQVSGTRGYEPPAIHIGTEHENPVRLSRQDLRSFAPDKAGYWRVQVEPGRYDVQLLFGKSPHERVANFTIRTQKRGASNTPTSQRVAAGASEATLPDLQLPPGAADVEAWLDRDGKVEGVQFVILRRQE